MYGRYLFNTAYNPNREPVLISGTASPQFSSSAYAVAILTGSGSSTVVFYTSAKPTRCKFAEPVPVSLVFLTSGVASKNAFAEARPLSLFNTSVIVFHFRWALHAEKEDNWQSWVPYSEPLPTSWKVIGIA